MSYWHRFEIELELGFSTVALEAATASDRRCLVDEAQTAWTITRSIVVYQISFPPWSELSFFIEAQSRHHGRTSVIDISLTEEAPGQPHEAIVLKGSWLVTACLPCKVLSFVLLTRT